MLRGIAKRLASPFENTAVHLFAVYLELVVREPLSYIVRSESPMRALAHDTTARGPSLSGDEIDRLRRTGYVVVDGVLTPSELRHARADADSLDGLGTADDSSWRRAGANQGGEHIRADSVTWLLEDGLGERSPRPGLATALRRLRGVASELAGSPSNAPGGSLAAAPGCWDGFDAARHEVPLGVPLACQLASYAPTEAAQASRDGPPVGYVPHRDGLPLSIVPRWSLRALEKSGTSSREVSALLYLNHAGAFAARATGGQLVLYLDAADEDEVGASCRERVEILPIGGRLVLFDSRRVLHEVLPHSAGSARVAFTCWIGGQWGSSLPSGIGRLLAWS